MSEPTYTLTLTSTQAALISAACDLISRLGIGQWPEFIRHMPGDLAFSGFHEARERLQPVMTDLLARHPIGPRRTVINGWTSNLGIFNLDAPESARQAWDMHQVLRHRLAWDKAIAQGLTDGSHRTPEMIHTDYDSPMQTSVLPLPVIRKDAP